jgi:hypothetical protein
LEEEEKSSAKDSSKFLNSCLLFKKKKNNYTIMKLVIVKPYYDWDGRKYIDAESQGSIIRIKIPFRYGRVMCHTSGIRPIQDIKKGEIIEATIENKVWDGTNFLILTSFEEANSLISVH